MNNGGQDASSLTKLNATTNPIMTACVDSAGTSKFITGGNCEITTVPVGATMRLTGGYDVKTQVIVVGTFNDGSNQVLLDTAV
jgi:hypothetical protein